jgi:antitoxin component of MazEF toxin-antitoxin module
MKRRLVQAGNSLAVTLPAEVVDAFGLRKGQAVDLSVHPQTGAVTIRPGVPFLEGGKVTRRFTKRVDDLLARRAELYRRLAR